MHLIKRYQQVHQQKIYQISNQKFKPVHFNELIKHWLKHRCYIIEWWLLIIYMMLLKHITKIYNAHPCDIFLEQAVFNDDKSLKIIQQQRESW